MSNDPIYAVLCGGQWHICVQRLHRFSHWRPQMLNILRAALIAGLLALPAAADHVRPWPTAASRLIPPPAYDPWRKPFGGKLTVLFVDHADVYATCRRLSKNPQKIGPTVLACSIPGGPTRCTIVLPRGMPADLLRAVRRHEVGHCKGWTHPNTTGVTEQTH